MMVKDIMTKKVAAMSPEDTVTDAAALMDDRDVGSVLVCDIEGLLGVVTDRDIVVRCVANGNDPSEMHLSDIMSKSPTYITPETTTLEASRLMAKNQIKRLPVVDDNQVVGVLSLGDLARNKDCDMEASIAISEICETKESHAKKRL